MPPYQNTRSNTKKTEEIQMINTDGSLHWCPSWCKCCEEALQRGKEQHLRIMKK